MASTTPSSPTDNPNDDFDPAYDKDGDGNHSKAENDARGEAKKAHETPGAHQHFYASPNPKPIDQK